jgi:hypothetical protein
MSIEAREIFAAHETATGRNAHTTPPGFAIDGKRANHYKSRALAHRAGSPKNT